jgi:hypothetical protein
VHDQSTPRGGKKTGKNPTDRAKQGVKRSLLVDADGIPVGMAVDGANRNDMKMVEETLASIPVERPTPTSKQPQGMCMDKGYDYDEVREEAKEDAARFETLYESKKPIHLNSQ